MGEERVKKSRSRRQKDPGGSIGPPAVVCTASSSNSNNIELGLIVSMIIMFVYAIGFYESVKSVPEMKIFNIKSANQWYQHMGENLNVARSEFTSAASDNSNNNNNQQQQESRQMIAKDQRQQAEKQPSTTIKGTGSVLNMPVGIPEEDIVIPKHEWPVSCRKEEYEPLLHSGDEKTILQVPKFWSLPVHNYRPMTREKAMKIGSCAEPDPVTGEIARGDKCPLDQRTIFVAIASYRDFECRTTVEDIFSRAKNPDRIRVGTFTFGIAKCTQLF